MSGFIYDNARKHFALGDIRWRESGGDTFRVFLLDSAYTPDKENHETLADIAAGYRFGMNNLWTPNAGFQLIIRDPVGGVFDAHDILITGLNTGLSIGYILIYCEGIADNSSLLLSLIDIRGQEPFITDGKDIRIGWDDGPLKIFRL